MKSKTLSYFVAAIAMSGMLASCSSSQMASSFGSRKYTKGTFFNTPATVGTIEANSTTSTPNVNAVTVENAKPSVAQAVASPSASTTANVVSAKTENEASLPTAKAKKINMNAVVAVAKTKAAAKVAGSENYFKTDKATGIETTTKAQWGNEGFHKHMVLYIIFVVVIVGLIILFAALGGSSYNSRDGVQ